jgi:hypothetical protein
MVVDVSVCPRLSKSQPTSSMNGSPYPEPNIPVDPLLAQNWLRGEFQRDAAESLHPGTGAADDRCRGAVATYGVDAGLRRMRVAAACHPPGIRRAVARSARAPLVSQTGPNLVSQTGPISTSLIRENVRAIVSRPFPGPELPHDLTPARARVCAAPPRA